jgi:acyl-CoA hydrolase
MEAFVDKVKIIRELKVYHSFTVFPDGLNYFGTLFGGKVLAEMDIAAGKAVRRLLYNTGCDGAATVSVDKVDFKRPAYLGDIIELEAEIVSLGNTSVKIRVTVTKEDSTGEVNQICEACFTFVALKDKKPYQLHF